MVSEQEGTATVNESISEDDTVATDFSSLRLTLRGRRWQTMLFLCFGTILIVVAGLWWYGSLKIPVMVQEPLDLPSVRFEHLCCTSRVFQ